MKVGDLAFDENNKVYINPEKVISYSDGEKNENYIFDSFKNSKDTSIFSMEVFDRIKDWPSEYHLTTYRQNILRPLDIKKNQTVLEIGAGCGAITRYLGEIGARVTAVEGSPSRARCIAERCRDLDNVKVVCSNVEDVEFDEKFDIVTLIGVFEYTAKYSQREDPFRSALKSYIALLKPGGSLVIAIENKLGLKYFAGFNEDHFALPYFGLESRYGRKDITTFGREEIKKMLEKTGFENTSFLYPFPDYKLPKVIISDNGLKHKGFNASDLVRFTKDRHYNPTPKANLLNEYLVWDSVGENGLLGDLSNSFLIVASKSANQELVDDSLVAQYYTCNRYEPYNTVTSFQSDNDEIKVVKDRLGFSATDQTHAEKLSQTKESETQYINGSNLHHQITGALFKNRYKTYERLMVAWIDYLKRETLVTLGDTNSLVKPSFFDALPFNIIVDHDGRLNLFDQEWATEKPFEIAFLVVRYLGMHRRNKGLYGKYAGSYLGFINKTLATCGLEKISKRKLREFEAEDEDVRNKINRNGGVASLQLKKSFIFLCLNKLKEIKSYLLFGVFAQR
jgi:2-polyprenyl-3-methyl-5-hydroxy-6-metoxy-1,4-benzoquinol methylase